MFFASFFCEFSYTGDVFMELNTPLGSIIHTTKAHLEKLQKMGIVTVGDLLGYFPRAVESTDACSLLPQIALGQKNTLKGQLFDIHAEKTPRGKKIVKASLVLQDEGTIESVWFHAPYLLKNLRDGSEVYLVGKVSRQYGVIQISNPEVHLHKNIHVDRLRPIYPESPPITSKWLREKIQGLLVFAKHLPEFLPEVILREQGFLTRAEALQTIHTPKDFDAWEQARKRFAFEEMFLIQTRVLQEKRRRERDTANPYRFNFDPELVKADIAALPFALTLAQKKVLFQCLKDFESDRPMHRLLQGDVGSGKTVVAFLAARQVVRAGFQVAFLAPTEILAEQHLQSAIQFFPPDVRVELLTGSTTEANKKKIKTHLADGDIHVLIGTHAILTEDTVWQDLGFAVIDEQHRFGVRQRSLLAMNHSHILSMTATPIPRSLALTIYGDQDLSILDEMPPGRKPIITRVVADARTRTLCHRFLDDHIEKGRQVFWVCPLVDESDAVEARNVKAEYVRISQEMFPHRRVEFLHGKMKPRDKESVMQRFKEGAFDILVSTSVIEVGVDIPNATIMVIENSERFGLAQLHQFRGRIGRNDMQSYCFLMVDKPDDKNRERLQAMQRSNDGFYLSEVDLKLRGMGELYGLRQSGLPDLRCADLSDTATMILARDWAQRILDFDLELTQYPLLKQVVDKEEVFL